MKIFLAVLGFLREPDDAYIADYLVFAKDVKAARELVRKETSGTHHLFFAVGETWSCWEGYCTEVSFDDVSPSQTPTVPMCWLKGIVQSGLIHDISLLEQVDREDLYEYVSTKLVRGGDGSASSERFRYGPYEISIQFAEDWENLLAPYQSAQVRILAGAFSVGQFTSHMTEPLHIRRIQERVAQELRLDVAFRLKLAEIEKK